MASMKRILAYLKSIIYWTLHEWQYSIIGLLGVAYALLFVFYSGTTECAVRINGMLLQLLGILTVAWGIYKTRKEFRHPSILTVWRQRFSRFPLFRKRSDTASGNAKMATLTSFGHGPDSFVAVPGAKIEERVKALEENLSKLYVNVSNLQIAIDKEFRKHANNLEQEKGIREKEDRNIYAKLEAAETGGLHISAMGTFWLFIGVIMSSMSNELAKWLI
jgi:hypothetical protein